MARETKTANHQENSQKIEKEPASNSQNNKIDLEDIEYNLLKLKTMRTSKMITQDEFNELRQRILPTKKSRAKKNNH